MAEMYALMNELENPGGHTFASMTLKLCTGYSQDRVKHKNQSFAGAIVQLLRVSG